MMGQIATFMETLHLSYDEVVRRIPYRNLVMMNADKLRVVYHDPDEPVVKKLSGKEMMMQKKSVSL